MKSAASELTILSILNQIPGKIGNSLWTLWARGANSGTEFPRWEPLLINRKWMVIMPPGANSTEGGAIFNSCVEWKLKVSPGSRLPAPCGWCGWSWRERWSSWISCPGYWNREKLNTWSLETLRTFMWSVEVCVWRHLMNIKIQTIIALYNIHCTCTVHKSLMKKKIQTIIALFIVHSYSV